MKTFDNLAVQIGSVLLPKEGTDFNKWAVIACDQFTSQPEYWQKVESHVGDAPSTYNLILPEVYLGQPDEPARIQNTQQTMRKYLDAGLLKAYEGLILVERFVDGKTRYGLMMALDLERYDFNKGSQSLIRATEGTILDRLPPRMRIREGAPLELPHILVLVDDPQRTVIEPLVANRENLTKIYDFDLMLGSGHLCGYFVQDAAVENQVIGALEKLAEREVFAQKYGVDEDKGVLLFAVGDGNHSLATAKSIWEKIKGQVGMNHPARYALVELENVHDEGLAFEPIHRVLFEVKQDFFSAIKNHFNGKVSFETVAGEKEMVKMVEGQTGPAHKIGVVSESGFGVLTVAEPPSNLPVGTLQSFLDGWLKAGGASKIDYVHGADVVSKLGSQPGHLGLYLPAMDKSDLFKTVILDGALPRKTFSMGEAHEKRFYMECRKIVS